MLDKISFHKQFNNTPEEISDSCGIHKGISDHSNQKNFCHEQTWKYSWNLKHEKTLMKKKLLKNC